MREKPKSKGKSKQKWYIEYYSKIHHMISATFLRNYFFYLRNIIRQHSLYASFECGAWRWTPCACSNEFYYQFSCFVVETDVFYVSAVLLYVWSDATSDYLFYELDDLRIIWVDLVWFYIKGRVHKTALSTKRGFFASK